jgi:hypothetical protein
VLRIALAAWHIIAAGGKRTMATKVIPNQYDLRGQGVYVSYSTSSIAGVPQLSLKKGRQLLTFSGDEIGVLDTQI